MKECDLRHLIWRLLLGRKGRFGHKSVSALIRALAAGPPLCQFKSPRFVFQLQFAMHESECWSRNHSVIKATSVNHQAQLQDRESEEQRLQTMSVFFFFLPLTFGINRVAVGRSRAVRGVKFLSWVSPGRG